MTNSELASWLKKGGRYVTLIEVATDTPHYLSTVAYATLPTDVPANRMYTPVVADGVDFSEKLSLSGSASLSYGDIELHNEDGRFDLWLDEVWVNRKISIAVGDVTWPRADFFTLFTGVVASLDSSNPGRLNITLRDKLERLNTPISEAVLAGATENKDQLLPIAIGEVHNITPLLVDPATHTYQVHNGAVERIVEVRDNGVPVSTTNALSTGKFSLVASPAGAITASVQGATPYVNTVGGCVKLLVKSYGTPVERFLDSDIDLTNFSNFETTNPQPVGVYIADKGNVLAVAQDIANSLGASLTMSREGKLRLVQLTFPPLTPTATITESDYEVGSFAISDRPEVLAGVRLNFCKNWTVQESLDTGIPAAHKDLFAKEWLTCTSRDATTASTYRLYAEPEAKTTLLLRRVDAEAEAARQLNIWKTQRTVYSFTGFAQLLLLEIGQSVTIKNRRYGLSDGKVGVVVGLRSNWITRKAQVEVMV